MVNAALILASSGGAQTLFGRTNLERILLLCQRVGVERFFIICTPERRGTVIAALGRFGADARVRIEGSVEQLLEEPDPPVPSQACLAVGADVVFARSHLDRLLREQSDRPGEVVRLGVANGGPDSILAVGPLERLTVTSAEPGPSALTGHQGLPFAVGEQPAARGPAEVRVARALRHETADYDGLMARMFDRRVSWRISRRLANTAVTPNQVTIANTVLGLVAAWMFAAPGYWTRLAAALLFLASVTGDGVDGELARLKLVESEAGKRLDVLTDNIVNVAVLLGLGVGCFRASASRTYVILMLAFLGGFGLCAVAVNRALRVDGDQAERWIRNVERICGRDFAYLLAALALFGGLKYFIWGGAFGTYAFALSLWWLTYSRGGLRASRPHPENRIVVEGL